MKRTEQQTARITGRFRRFVASAAAITACCLASHVAEAHLTYGGRDFGSFSGQTNATQVITNQTVTGNYGWADAADGVLGDSHRGRAFRFHLDNPALVTLRVGANPGATPTSLGGLTPAFSLYAGLAAVAPFAPSQTTNPPSADHDGTPASLAWRTWWVRQNINPSAPDEAPTDGSWNSVGDFRIGGDGDLAGDFSQLSSLIYRGSAAAPLGATNITGSFVLPAGDYTIIIGGNDIANKTGGTALSGFGIAASLSVAPTPNLSIASKVFVAWPSSTTTNWSLQSAASVNATNWSGVTNAPITLDGQTGVLLDGSASKQFFRWSFAP